MSEDGFEFEQETDGEESRDEKIRQVFQKCGGNSDLHSLELLCEEEGIFTFDEIKSMGRVQARRICQSALSRKDAEGRPWAGVTSERYGEKHGRLWVQREFWTVETYETNIKLRIDLAGDNLRTARALAGECQDRFGIEISVPDLVAN